MVAAIELYFDGDSQARLRRLWDALEAAGVPSLREHTHRRHRPHLSLAVARRLDPEHVAAAVRGLLPPDGLRLEFTTVGQFPRRVLWLGPAVGPELLALHRGVHERLTAAGVEVADVYRPGAWVPHCTVSQQVPWAGLARAVGLCLDALPITASLRSAAVVDHTRGLYRPID
ncbi:MAG TPA: 2'-5' RNA ligase family protein [Actinocatenispora sp.]